jgi:hypothetical protein
MKWLAYFSLFIILGCNNRTDKSYEEAKYIGKTSLSIDKIVLDTVRLDSISTSYFGNTEIYGDHIYYIDRKFCYVHKFDMNGKKRNRYIGVGDQKNELPLKTIDFTAFSPNGNFIVIGPSWDVFIFDSSFNKINDYAINWHWNVSKEEMLKKPDPSNAYIYSLAYQVSKIKATNNKVFFPIASQHPDFNPAKYEYAIQARILGKMNIANGYIEGIFGKFSPTYAHNGNKMVLGYAIFDLVNEDSYYMTFPADSLIYKVNNDFSVMESFGRQGRAMDTSYITVNDLKHFALNYRKQAEERGYYTSIKYIKSKNLVFRTYHKNATDNSDGLQIYRDGTLIGDVDVPKGFEVNGYIHPYCYSNSYINEEAGTIKVYKFKVD